MADTSAGSSSGANGTASGGPTASSGAHSADSTAASNGGVKPRGRRRGAAGAAALQRTPSATKRLAERSARQRQSLMSSRMHSDPSLLKVGGRDSAARARRRRRGGRNITDLSGTTLARKRHRGSVEARALAALAARKRREADRTRQLVANLELEHLVKPLRTKRLNMKQALYVDGCLWLVAGGYTHSTHSTNPALVAHRYALERQKRNRFYVDLLRYVVFLLVFLWVTLSLPIHYPYEQVRGCGAGCLSGCCTSWCTSWWYVCSLYDHGFLMHSPRPFATCSSTRSSRT